MTTNPTHDALFRRYLEELTAARKTALQRAEGRLKTWTRRLGSEARAREKLAKSAPPCTDARVIGVLRKYWLECEALNRQAPHTTVDPREFLLSRLQATRADLASFLEPLPYWPMGKDERGNWI
jgi:hypothetical protein